MIGTSYRFLTIRGIFFFRKSWNFSMVTLHCHLEYNKSHRGKKTETRAKYPCIACKSCLQTSTVPPPEHQQ